MHYPAFMLARIRLYFAVLATAKAKDRINAAIRNTRSAAADIERLYEQFLKKAKKEEEIAVSVKRHSRSCSNRPILNETVEIGTVEMTEAAKHKLTRFDIDTAFVRHRHGDWGSVSDFQWLQNNDALLTRNGVLQSRYRCHDGQRFRIRTDLKTGRSLVHLEGEK